MAVFVLAICNVSITGKVRNQHFPPDVSAHGSAEINSFSEKKLHVDFSFDVFMQTREICTSCPKNDHTLCTIESYL